MTGERGFGPLQWAIVLLAAATAAIHLWLAFQFPGGPDPLFILNGIGYLGLVGLLYLPVAGLRPYRNWVRWVLIAYTLVTILAWVFIGVRSTIAYVDKVIELALVICLWLEWARTRR